MEALEQQPFETTCADGVILRGVLIIPNQVPKAVVQFNGGTGARKEFYQPFLEYLAQRGYLCCLWDYRGMGASALPTLKGCPYTFRDYGIQDMPAIRRFLQSRYPALPLLLVAHSAGGQQVGFSEGIDAYQGLLAIAVSTGYRRLDQPKFTLRSLYFFYGLTPISHLLFGYLRAKPLGIMENLPTPLVREWRAWCSKPDYFFDAAFANKTVPTHRYQHLPFPVHIFYTIDDAISSEANTRRFWSHIQSAHDISFRKWQPKELEVARIDHFGFFRSNFRDTIWREALDCLDDFAARPLPTSKKHESSLNL